ncbi:MAG: hypothetical protein ACQEP1_04965 [Nanobdellota archaeon]
MRLSRLLIFGLVMVLFVGFVSGQQEQDVYSTHKGHPLCNVLDVGTDADTECWYNGEPTTLRDYAISDCNNEIFKEDRHCICGDKLRKTGEKVYCYEGRYHYKCEYVKNPDYECYCSEADELIKKKACDGSEEEDKEKNDEEKEEEDDSTGGTQRESNCTDEHSGWDCQCDMDDVDSDDCEDGCETGLCWGSDSDMYCCSDKFKEKNVDSGEKDKDKKQKKDEKEVPNCEYNEKIEEECNCDGEPIREGKVCCEHSKSDEGDPVVKTKVDKCPVKPCDSDCGYDEECKCPSECENADKKIGKDGGTCGGKDPDQLCEVKSGECMSEKQCQNYQDPEKDSYETVSDNSGRKGAFDCNKDEVCCELEGDDEPNPLRRCDEKCADPDGCNCYDHCFSNNESDIDGYEDIDSPGDSDIPPGYTCRGRYYGNSGSFSRCSGADTKDGRCPPGCFWFNDRDCGRDANLGDALWTLAEKAGWLSDYNKKWRKWWRDLGATFDITYWAQSWCNPTNRGFTDDKNKHDTIIGTTNMVGWLGGEKEVYNSTKYIYTINWYLSGLNENNKYRISLSGEDTYSTDWMNISAGETQQGEEASLVKINHTEFDKVCLKFKDEVHYTSESKIYKNKGKVEEVCRGLA